jgi:hypothetical protein
MIEAKFSPGENFCRVPEPYGKLRLLLGEQGWAVGQAQQ